MENRNNSFTHHLSEEIVTEILGRLPLRSISRFKSVCKTWKSILESLYFRRLFLSLHQNKSRSWLRASSLLRYMIDFHRCQTWGLPKPLGYYFQNIVERSHSITYRDSSNGLVLIELDLEPYSATGTHYYYVGNPILQQWVVIPIDGCPWKPSLVTRVDEDGVVLSFKVVTLDIVATDARSSTSLDFSVYSSETGIWTSKELHIPHYFDSSIESTITLHGTLYICLYKHAIIAHDFYGESNVCRVIPVPLPGLDWILNRSLTTSTEFVIYIKTLPKNVLKVWRLVNTDDDDSPWELLWETRLEFISFDDNITAYDHVTVHPFDRNIVYLWSPKNRYLVSCNLKTQNYHILIDQLQEGDLQNCFVNHSVCEKHMDGLCSLYLHRGRRIKYTSFEYVFPRWMGSIPCPPCAEILDTTSLLSEIIKSSLF